MSRIRHGGRFRIKIDEHIPGSKYVGDSRHITERPNESIDEVVIDDWIHLERMDVSTWWIGLGDARIIVQLKHGEKPIVNIERGGQEEPIRGETWIGNRKVDPAP